MFKAQGWDKILNDGDLVLSQATTTRASTARAHIWGISVYGEYVSVLLQHDMFDGEQASRSRPRSTSSSPTWMPSRRRASRRLRFGASTPAAASAGSLAYTKADDTWVQNYQGLKAPLDTAPLSLCRADHDRLGEQGLHLQGLDRSQGRRRRQSVHLGQGADVRLRHLEPWHFASTIKDFKWGQFLIPTPKYSVGSTGNLWIVPKGSKNPDLAAEFISLTAVAEVPDRARQ